MGEKGKTCILFGAGAETSFKLCNGAEYARKVIGRGTEVMDEAIVKYYNDQYEKLTGIKKDWYPKPSKQHITEIGLLKASAKKEHLEKLLNQEKGIEDVKKFLQEITKNLEVYLKKSNSGTGEEKDKKEVNENGWMLIDENTSYMGVLDEKFHTLILPNALGPNKFWKVVFCYTRAYLTLALAMYGCVKNSEQECYKRILENPKEFLDKANEFCRSKEDELSYYKCLRDCKEKDNIRIITTNYTPLCSRIAGIYDKNIAYVHGRMGWFESPYKLEVYDLIGDGKLPEDDIYFPYIFVQSGVKPIVDRRQIEEYHKMITFLDESEKLIILGYRANIDDNHLNGIIKSFLNSDKKVVYFEYDKKHKEVTDAEIQSVLSRFRTNEKKCNFEIIKIDDHNGYKRFEEAIM